eukprot:7333230-Prymnesium_polylepis.1
MMRELMRHGHGWRESLRSVGARTGAGCSCPGTRGTASWPSSDGYSWRCRGQSSCQQSCEQRASTPSKRASRIGARTRSCSQRSREQRGQSEGNEIEDEPRQWQWGESADTRVCAGGRLMGVPSGPFIRTDERQAPVTTSWNLGVGLLAHIVRSKEVAAGSAWERRERISRDVRG